MNFLSKGDEDFLNARVQNLKFLLQKEINKVERIRSIVNASNIKSDTKIGYKQTFILQLESLNKLLANVNQIQIIANNPEQLVKLNINLEYIESLIKRQIKIIDEVLETIIKMNKIAA